MPNVAYGSGTHVCIGEYLSLVELECAFKGLFTRMPNLKVTLNPDPASCWACKGLNGLARGQMGLQGPSSLD
jgi:cytochrome P450